MLNTLLKLSPSTRLGIADNPLLTNALFEDTDTNQIVLGAYEWDAVLSQWQPPLSAGGLTSFGSDPLATVSLANRVILALASGNPPGQIPDLPLAEILGNYILGSLADPTGLIRTKPLQMSRRNGIGVHFGSYGRVQLGNFEINSQHPNFQGMLNVFTADYNRMVIEGVSKAQRNKVVGYQMIQVYGKLADEHRDSLVPLTHRSVDPSDDYALPATPITDDFTRIDNVTLGASSEGWSWTEVDGDTDIVSNAARTPNSSSACNRAESALSSADMYAQANSSNGVEGAGRGCGGAVRYDSGADTCYWHRGARGSGGITTHELIERTAGVNATHSSTGAYTDANGGVHRIEIVGSDIELFYNGASRHTASDASITGNLYSGICGNHNGNNRLSWDNFKADIIVPRPYAYAVMVG